MRRTLLIALAVLAVLSAPSLIRADQVNFDNVTAQCCYNGTTYSPFVTPSITFTNGVVLSNDGWDGLATTAPNVYGTSDFLSLSDSTFLPGNVVGTFTSGLGSGLSLDVIDGSAAATFTLTAFDALNNVLDTESIALNCFGCSGSVGTLTSLASGIDHFAVTSSQTPGQIDFAIDTVNFTTATPEPATLTMLGMGLLGLARLRNRKRTA